MLEKDLLLGATQCCLNCDEVKPLEQGEAVVRFGSFIEFTCYDCKNWPNEYKLEITFRANRPLTEEELGQLQTQCCDQVWEPVTADGEDVTYKTDDVCTDIRPIEGSN